MKRGSTFALLLCAAATGGCASQARIINIDKDKGTGTVAIPNNTDNWPTYNRTAAEDLITKQVGPGFRIVSEGEYVKGKSKQVSLDGNSASFTQQKITEYRITFERVLSPSSPPLSPGGTGLMQTGAREPAPGQAPLPSPVPSVLPGSGPPVPAGPNGRP